MITNIVKTVIDAQNKVVEMNEKNLFSQHIPEQKFRKLYPNTPDSLYKEILNYIHLADIKTKDQLAKFLSQCAHEQANFQKFQESLNYSVQGLLNTFPKYFNKELANKYGYIKDKNGVTIQKANQQGIANIAYANRMGNGGPLSGDGWKYRGRGLIQLTGKNNYIKFQEFVNDPEIVQNPDKILTSMKYIVLTAIFFWKENNLSKIEDYTALTRRINGGTNGLAHRLSEYNKLMA